MSNQATTTTNFTREQLEAMPGPELVRTFNSIPGVRQVKKFSSRGAGVNRILTLQGSSALPVVSKAKVRKTYVASEGVEMVDVDYSSLTKGRKRLPRGTYDMEADAEKQESRNMRPSSGKGQLHEALREGATFDELLADEQFADWGPEKLHYTIRSLSWWHGYALRTDENGTITVENQ